MSLPPTELASLMVAWLEEHDAPALEAACHWVKTHPVDVGALLAWVEAYGADEDATTLAIRRLRFALGLPVIPGPVCRR